MANIYFTSDLHLGHQNIIKYDNRPFFSVKDMDETIIERWNSKVHDNDTVYVLGDISWYPAHKTAELLKSMRGKKILIIGNHDKRLIRSHDVQQQFKEISHYKETTVQTQTRGTVDVVLSHYYMPFFNKSFHGAVLLYAHTHNSKEHDTEVAIQRYLRNIGYKSEAYNVGCMLWKYTPVTLDEMFSKPFVGRRSELSPVDDACLNKQEVFDVISDISSRR